MARVSKFAKTVLQLFLLIIISVLLDERPIRSVKIVPRFVQDMRHILIWTNFPGLGREGQVMFIKRGCLHYNCYLTTNRSLLGDLRYFDALVFNVKDVARGTMDLPKVRNTMQKYIFAANDSAETYPVCNRVYDNFFNWTWTYRIDSAIAFTYIAVFTVNNQELGRNFVWLPYEKMKPTPPLFQSTLQSKSKAVAIIINKCETGNKKMEFVKKLDDELSKYNLNVDVLGHCGNTTCGRRNIRSCYYRLKTTYYFYLALEDSIAMDYITNTVLTGFNNNAVPIVHGGAQYSRYLPPYSYLDATLFSMPALAKAIKDIIHNKQKYYEFFRWKNHYVIKETKTMNVCRLCNALNDKDWLQMKVTYPNFRGWWHVEFERLCNIKETYLF